MTLTLAEIWERREAAKAEGGLWQLTASDLRAAYAAGERDFSCADLGGENLADFKLEGVDFSGAFLHGACLNNADLTAANFQKADLSYASFIRTKLFTADFRGATIDDCVLIGAAWGDTKGIIALYVPDASARGDVLYAVDWREHDGSIRVKAGCFWGTLEKFEQRVIAYKGEDALYLKMIPVIRAAFPVAQAGASPSVEAAPEFRASLITDQEMRDFVDGVRQQRATTEHTQHAYEFQFDEQFWRTVRDNMRRATAIPTDDALTTPLPSEPVVDPIDWFTETTPRPTITTLEFPLETRNPEQRFFTQGQPADNSMSADE